MYLITKRKHTRILRMSIGSYIFNLRGLYITLFSRFKRL